MIRRVIRAAELDNYDPDGTSPQSDAEVTESLSEATIITSEIDTDNRLFPELFEDQHAPVIDLDFPATLIPSSTPGHYHLYLDKMVPKEKYFALLDALAEAELIEEGYAAVSKERGYTAVRLPWVEK